VALSLIREPGVFKLIDNKKLAAIHIVKKELNLSDEEYRNILREAAQVDSAKDLDDDRFRRVMNYFVRSKYYQLNPAGLTIRQKLYIKYLAQELGWEDSHLRNFLHKYYHKFNMEELSRKEAVKVIESLKHIGQHQRAP